MSKITVAEALRLGSDAYQLGKFSEAKNYFEKILNMKPDHADANHNLGVILARAGQYKDAASLFQRAIKANPQAGEFWLSYITALLNLEQFTLADSILSDLIERNFDEEILKDINYNIYLKKAQSCQNKNDFKEAIDFLCLAIKLDQKKPEAYIASSLLYKKLEDPLKALESLEYARKQQVFVTEIYTNAIEICEKYNMLARAEHWLLLAKKTFEPLPIELEFSQASLSFRKLDYNTVKEAFSDKFIQSLDLNRQIIALELLAKSNEFLGDYEKATTSFENMNSRMESAYMQYDFNEQEFLIPYINQRKQLSKLSRHEIKARIIQDNKIRISFMVGFPRSGSTLLSKIFQAHPMIDCIDEYPLIQKTKFAFKENREVLLPVDNLLTARNYYQEYVYKHLKIDRSKIVIDKRPLNILELPTICQIFPESKILVLIRHPYDAVLSCWMQNFEMNSAMKLMTSLEKIVKLYCLSMETLVETSRVMDVDISYVKYEDFIMSPKYASRIYLASLGVDWVDDMENYRKKISNLERISTPSYHQVIQPIYFNSVNRWRNYIDKLTTFAEALDPWVLKFGYTKKL